MAPDRAAAEQIHRIERREEDIMWQLIRDIPFAFPHIYHTMTPKLNVPVPFSSLLP
jgi:hypothetical protein